MFGIAEHLGKQREHASMENVSSEELCCFIVWDLRAVWSGLGEHPRDVKTSSVQPQRHLRRPMKNRCLSRSQSASATNADLQMSRSPLVRPAPSLDIYCWDTAILSSVIINQSVNYFLDCSMASEEFSNSRT